MRKCFRCQQRKPDDEFYKDRSHSSGLSRECKACCRKRSNRPYRERNTTAHKANKAKWKRGHPERVKAQRQRRRARHMRATGSFTSRQWEALCRRYDFRCLRCGQRKSLTPDHVLPLSLGGSNDISNIQPLCGPCNYSKGAHYIDYRPIPATQVDQLSLWAL